MARPQIGISILALAGQISSRTILFLCGAFIPLALAGSADSQSTSRQATDQPSTGDSYSNAASFGGVRQSSTAPTPQRAVPPGDHSYDNAASFGGVRQSSTAPAPQPTAQNLGPDSYDLVPGSSPPVLKINPRVQFYDRPFRYEDDDEFGNVGNAVAALEGPFMWDFMIVGWGSQSALLVENLAGQNADQPIDPSNKPRLHIARIRRNGPTTIMPWSYDCATGRIVEAPYQKPLGAAVTVGELEKNLLARVCAARGGVAWGTGMTHVKLAAAMAAMDAGRGPPAGPVTRAVSDP